MYRKVNRDGRTELVFEARSAAVSWCLYAALLASFGGGSIIGYRSLAVKLPEISDTITALGKAKPNPKPAILASR